MASVSDERRDTILKLTLEQYEAISAFFNFNNWDFDAALVANPWEGEEDTNDREENISVSSLADLDQNQNISNNGQDNAALPVGNPDGEDDNFAEGECHYCLCKPCVTINPQSWLGNKTPAHVRNSRIRKEKYKKFWSLLSNQSVWIDPRYQRRKLRLLRRNENSGYVWTKREIMPDYILELVREFYPNSENKPYIGHQWI